LPEKKYDTSEKVGSDFPRGRDRKTYAATLAGSGKGRGFGYDGAVS